MHTGGFSLARKVLFDQLGLSPEDPLPGFRVLTKPALMRPHVNYAGFLKEALRRFNKGGRGDRRKENGLFGAAHISGGGFTGNIPRILPDNYSYKKTTSSWKPLPVFQAFVEGGRIDFGQAYEVFNMGIGMVLVVDAARVDAFLNSPQNTGSRAGSSAKSSRATEAAR